MLIQFYFNFVLHPQATNYNWKTSKPLSKLKHDLSWLATIKTQCLWSVALHNDNVPPPGTLQGMIDSRSYPFPQVQCIPLIKQRTRVTGEEDFHGISLISTSAFTFVTISHNSGLNSNVSTTSITVHTWYRGKKSTTTYFISIWEKRRNGRQILHATVHSVFFSLHWPVWHWH